MPTKVGIQVFLIVLNSYPEIIIDLQLFRSFNLTKERNHVAVSNTGMLGRPLSG